MLPPCNSEVREITFLVSHVALFVICNYLETNGITRLDTTFFIETLPFWWPFYTRSICPVFGDDRSSFSKACLQDFPALQESFDSAKRLYIILRQELGCPLDVPLMLTPPGWGGNLPGLVFTQRHFTMVGLKPAMQNINQYFSFNMISPELILYRYY